MSKQHNEIRKNDFWSHVAASCKKFTLTKNLLDYFYDFIS